VVVLEKHWLWVFLNLYHTNTGRYILDDDEEIRAEQTNLSVMVFVFGRDVGRASFWDDF
jgi:hypothetical protein